MKEKIHFIIVDDDYGTNTYCRIIIEKYIPEVNVNLFMVPEDALAYIKELYSEVIVNNTILLLDINMPTMTGWEFLEIFEQFDDRIKDQITIYMFSSSVDPHDMEQAKNIKKVSGYLVKPLTRDMVTKLCT